jgi:hypothetical protein
MAMNRSEVVDALVAHHVESCLSTVNTLTNGVPAEGGRINRRTLENVVREAFVGGAVAQLDRPFKRQGERQIVVKGGTGESCGDAGLVRLRASTGETWHVREDATLQELLAHGFTLRVESASAGRPLVLFKPE